MKKPLSHYELFLCIEQTIQKAHALDEYAIGSFKRQHIKHRAFFLMKFDMLLDSYRKSYNSKADHLHGKNAAIAMCCEKLKISPLEAKRFTLDEIILSLHIEINNFPVPEEVIDDIRNPYQLDLPEMEHQNHQLGPFIDAEWDPEIRYRLMSRGQF
ncbi:ECs1072 family phage-associated protein [Pantoea dispersa]